MSPSSSRANRSFCEAQICTNFVGRRPSLTRALIDAVVSCPGSRLLDDENLTVGSDRASSSLIGWPWASTYRILPATSRTVWFVEVFFSRKIPVSFAWATTRSEPFSTRSVTFMSTNSPATIPALTFSDDGVTAYALSSATAAVAEDKAYAVTPSSLKVKAGIVAGEFVDMKVTERVEKGSDRVVAQAKLTGILRLKNTSTNQTVPLR